MRTIRWRACRSGTDRPCDYPARAAGARACRVRQELGKTMTAKPGPGLAWLAARTGKDPKELIASPAALAAAVRELASLAARTDSEDPTVRATAQAELDALRAQMRAAPSPGETFGKTLAQILRDTAERLSKD